MVMNSNVDDDKVADVINKMNYRDFLQTPYWKVIAAKKRKDSNFRCEVCNNKSNLQVHHKTYERHGYEHLSNVLKNDLIVLCEECHKRVAHKIE